VAALFTPGTPVREVVEWVTTRLGEGPGGPGSVPGAVVEAPRHGVPTARSS
jgi:hypothetical protein